MPQKVNLIFELGTNGWSETYYTDQTSGQPLIDAFNVAYGLADRRSQLLGTPANLTAIRVADVDNPRRSTLTAVGEGTPYPLTSYAYDSNADKVQTSALLGCTDVNGTVQRRLYISGNPDNVYNVGQPINPDRAAWNLKLNGFTGVLTNGTWQIRGHSRITATDPGSDVTNVIVYASDLSKTQLTLDPDVGAVEQDYIKLYKIPGLNTPMGIQRVLKVVNPGVYVVGYTLPSGFSFAPGGKGILLEDEFQAIGFATFERIVSRKRGRPLSLTRGRRRSVHP